MTRVESIEIISNYLYTDIGPDINDYRNFQQLIAVTPADEVRYALENTCKTSGYHLEISEGNPVSFILYRPDGTELITFLLSKGTLARKPYLTYSRNEEEVEPILERLSQELYLATRAIGVESNGVQPSAGAGTATYCREELIYQLRQKFSPGKVQDKTIELWADILEHWHKCPGLSKSKYFKRLKDDGKTEIYERQFLRHFAKLEKSGFMKATPK